MSRSDTTATTASASRPSDLRDPRPALTAGLLAGPVFIGSSLIQAYTREGFDLGRHPVSLLALGSHGWIQVATFVATGLLLSTCAVGVHRALPRGRASVAGPLLIAGMGAGMIIAGIFPTDAGAGFPAGAPDGAPQPTAIGMVHEAGFALTVLAWTAAGVVFARRFAAERRRGWVAGCVAALAVAWGVAGWPDLDSLSVRLVLTSAVQLGSVGVLAWHLRRR